MRLIGDKLSSVRGGRTLFAELTFTVAEGETLVVTGANGSGKTSLLRTIAGFLPPAAGRIGMQDGASEQVVRERCHYIGHVNAVKSGLSVAQNARFWAGFMGGARDGIDRALDAFGLLELHDIPAGYLSAGQQRRLGLARLLLAERPLWLLDEPSASLDSVAQAALMSVVNAHLASGGLVVAATHAPLGFDRSRELRLGPAVISA